MKQPEAQKHSWQVWLVATRSEEIAGEWIGHCLDFDVVTQGTSLKHVMGMLVEACGLVAADDVQNGRDPQARRAPVEFWEDMHRLLARGHILPGGGPLLDFGDSFEWLVCNANLDCLIPTTSTSTGDCLKQPMTWAPSVAA